MKKHIDDKVLSLPPYVSTAWENVKALYLKKKDLIVDLLDGTAISVPGLAEEEIEEIFNFHAAYIEKSHEHELIEEDFKILGEEGESPFRFAIDSLDGISGAMEHNPQQANMPPLPPEVLNKIAHIARIVSPEEVQSLAPPVDGCNCFYCQITRAITSAAPQENRPKMQDEFVGEVADEELVFTQWAVSEIEDQLYLVTNKLDTSEQYKVFLGEPVGCTCGEEHCEHIVAVLKS
ncbi:MAG: hypothetical protein K940chlam3_01690 [Chlamydiae bacterium]|nr:hypothetical protein [Chlamydiota bacterium]